MTLGKFVGVAVVSVLVYALFVLLMDRQGVRDAIALVPKQEKKEPST
jgi:hypothetical protein